MITYLVPVMIFFIVLVTIQYSLNKIIVLLKEIKELLQNLTSLRK